MTENVNLMRSKAVFADVVASRSTILIGCLRSSYGKMESVQVKSIYLSGCCSYRRERRLGEWQRRKVQGRNITSSYFLL